jgi:long-chain fatty acid transport protein
MKKILLISTITAASLYATNGDNLIGLGAESRALGGTGIAMYQGSENAMSNPALLGKTKNAQKELTIAATLFKPTVSATTTAGANVGGNAPGVSKESDVGMSPIPYVSHAHRISNSLTFGFGLYGTAGMGVDYTGDTVSPGMGQTKLYNMKSELQIMQIAPSIAYNKDNYGIGLSIIAQYGKLSIDFDGSRGNRVAGVNHVGDNKMSSDTGFGYQVGGYMDITDTMTIAATYKSAIDMTYGTEISDAATAFGYGLHAGALAAKTDHLEQPSELGLGASITHKTMTYTADYKTIKRPLHNSQLPQFYF